MITEIKTENGYDFFEALSAFQKCIRRGLEDDALFWGVELSFKTAEYVWKRMKVISSEDVGFATPGISTEINSLYQMWKELAKKKDDKHFPERLFLVHAIIMLARAKKSRYVDWQTCYVFGCHTSRFRQVPDFAYDKHTRHGKKLGRSMSHFIEEGCKLENYCPDEHEEVAKENALKALSGLCQSLF